MDIKDNIELQGHIKALGNWADEDKKRVAVVVCGELDDEGCQCACSLVGTRANAALALFSNAMNQEEFRTLLKLVTEALDDPFKAAFLLSNSTMSPKSPDLRERLDRMKDLAEIVLKTFYNEKENEDGRDEKQSM